MELEERRRHLSHSRNIHCRERVIKIVSNQQLDLLLEDVYENSTNHTCKSFPRFCHGVSTVLGKLGLDVAITVALMVGEQAKISDKELQITDCQQLEARQYLESMQRSLVFAGWKSEADTNGNPYFSFEGTNASYWSGLLQQWSGAYFVLERFGLL